jgi:hypothetical protein
MEVATRRTGLLQSAALTVDILLRRAGAQEP